VIPNLVYVVVVGVLFAAGVSLLLERSLTRVLMGLIMLGNGVNLLILMGGTQGRAPIVDGSATPMSDPLPQAMILTAIVITLGITAFLLALAYRGWQVFGNDEVQDDVEDRRVRERAEQDEGPDASDSDGDVEDVAVPAGGGAGRR
jgi:multicomponent Na+:H+ antiporter subunit C